MAAATHSHPLCAWSGTLEESDDERIVQCLKPALGYVEGPEHHRTFCCEEHVGWAKEHEENGEFVRIVRTDDASPPPTHHGVSAQARHEFTTAGHFE